MATEVQNRTERGADNPATLLSGIANDLQDLIKQQLLLTRKEMEADFRRTSEAASTLALGVSLSLVALAFLGLMLAHGLHLMFATATAQTAIDPSSLPLCGCYGIVGILFGVAGGILVYAGIKKFASFNPLPDESAAALQENVQWLMNKK